MFQQRHFEALASELQAIGETETRRQFALLLADLFRRHNPRFSRSRFLAACEPGANVLLRTNYQLPADYPERRI